MSLVNDLGESKVTVKKDELLSKMMANREKHVKEYELAWSGYKTEMISFLNLTVDEIKHKGVVDTHRIGALPRPQNHAKEYDRVIQMLQMSIATEIVITEQQFQMYVMDEWTWKQAFEVTKSRYSK